MIEALARLLILPLVVVVLLLAELAVYVVEIVAWILAPMGALTLPFLLYLAIVLTYYYGGGL